MVLFNASSLILHFFQTLHTLTVRLLFSQMCTRIYILGYLLNRIMTITVLDNLSLESFNFLKQMLLRLSVVSVLCLCPGAKYMWG